MSELTFYNTLLIDIKQRIRQAQTKAFMTANAEMISMYWDIGYMIRYAKEYGTSILQQAMAKLPEQALLAGILLGHLRLFIEKIRDLPVRFRVMSWNQGGER